MEASGQECQLRLGEQGMVIFEQVLKTKWEFVRQKWGKGLPEEFFGEWHDILHAWNQDGWRGRWQMRWLSG